MLLSAFRKVSSSYKRQNNCFCSKTHFPGIKHGLPVWWPARWNILELWNLVAWNFPTGQPLLSTHHLWSITRCLIWKFLQNGFLQSHKIFDSWMSVLFSLAISTVDLFLKRVSVMSPQRSRLFPLQALGVSSDHHEHSIPRLVHPEGQY